MAGMSWKTCLLYLDDIIVYSRTFQEHTERLKEVLERIQQAGLKIKASKCCLYQGEVAFLGHIVSGEGIQADPAKTRAVQNWEQPNNITDVRSFLGLCSYYRRFVKDFSKIAAPLTRLNEKAVPFQWKAEQQEAFQELKDRLSSPPILGYPQNQGEYILDTDASDTGLCEQILSVQTPGMHLGMQFGEMETRPSARRRLHQQTPGMHLGGPIARGEPETGAAKVTSPSRGATGSSSPLHKRLKDLADLRFPTRKEEREAESETEPEDWETELEEVPAPPRREEPEQEESKQQTELVNVESKQKPDIRIVVLKPETVEQDLKKDIFTQEIPEAVGQPIRRAQRESRDYPRL